MDISAFFRLSYGVFIVATGNDTQKNGFVATTAIQVTSEPNQLLVACNKKNFSASLIAENKAFSVSVFNRSFSPAILGGFGFRSGRDADKFEGVNYLVGKETGVPIVTDDAVAWFECRLVNTFDVGTHLLFIGEVVDAQILSANDTPLTYAYYHEVKKGTVPANAPHATVKQEDSKQEKIINTDKTMKKYQCSVCGYIYDPEVGDPDSGIAPGTAFEDIPTDWTCPLCGVGKDSFEPVD